MNPKENRQFYFDLTRDITFQYFFRKNTRILKLLLKAFLPLPKNCSIDKVKILNSSSHPRNPENKHFIFDLKLKLSSGEMINVEMQNFPEGHFLNRISFYLSKLYSDELKKGQEYSELCPAYSLIFTKHTLFPETGSFYSSFSMRSDNPPYFVFNDSLRVVTVELSKFTKTNIESLIDLREFWCYILKQSSQMDDTHINRLAAKGVYMKEVMNYFDELSKDEQLRVIEEEKMKAEWIRHGQLEYAKNQGLNQGLKEGREKGLKRGLEEGRQKGLKKGLAEGKKAGEKKAVEKVALNMLAEKTDTDFISKMTGLSKKEILDLKTKRS